MEVGRGAHLPGQYNLEPNREDPENSDDLAGPDLEDT